MFGEFKYSVWAMSVKIFLLYFVSIIVNVMVIFGLLGVFQESSMWKWFIQVISLLVHFGIMYMFVSADGRRDILLDGANEKRAERYPEFKFEAKYDERKGFVAGAISQIPLVVLSIIWFSLSKPVNIFELLVNVLLLPYFEIKTALGVNILSLLLFVGLMVAVTGLAYIAAKSYRKKVLTIIKRNEEKALARGIVKGDNK